MDLRGLYQELILDHARRPRNHGALAGANRSAEGVNPLCGDRFRVELVVDGDRIDRLAFQGSGCAISTASASLLTEMLTGRTVAEALALFREFQEMVTADSTLGTQATPRQEERLGKLAALRGVCEFPTRVKCATLAWHALVAALRGGEPTVTTERGSSYA